MKIRICGLDFDDIGTERAVREAFAGGQCFAVTPNALMLEDCLRVPAHLRLLARASLILPDGAGILRAAAKSGTPFVHGRVAGIDFGEALIRESARRGERVFLLGGGDGIARRAAEALRARHPSLTVAGTYWGYFDRDGEENRNLVGILRACRPTVLLVCLGYPAQEEWIAANLSRLPSVRVAVGLGGSFDVWAGKVHRAPRLWQRAGLEWAWRMLREPHRMENLPALLRFSRLSVKNAPPENVKMHMEANIRTNRLNENNENDKISSKPL